MPVDEASWIETRNGLNADNLPHTFHDTTIEEYVDMKGVIHLMDYSVWTLSDSLANFRNRQPLKNVKDLKDAAIRTYKTPELQKRAGSDV